MECAVAQSPADPWWKQIAALVSRGDQLEPPNVANFICKKFYRSGHLRDTGAVSVSCCHSAIPVSNVWLVLGVKRQAVLGQAAREKELERGKLAPQRAAGSSACASTRHASAAGRKTSLRARLTWGGVVAAAAVLLAVAFSGTFRSADQSGLLTASNSSQRPTVRNLGIQ